MESSLIFAASDSLKYKVNWVRVSDETEWTYFGSGVETNTHLVLKSIQDYFPDPILYVALSRKDSVQANRKDIDNAIDQMLGSENFFIWDMQFKRVIEFNSIGVMRQGYI